MSVHDITYLNLLQDVINNGERVTNRTGVETISLLGAQARYDLADGFPALVSKKLAWKKSIAEMLWFISGKCDFIEGLDAMGAGGIWRPWALTEDGYLGPIYGRQWRNWDCRGHWDQLTQVIDQIKAGSDSRRLIVSAWNVSQIDDMALPPCHVLFQFTVRSGKLHLQLYQRSCDLPIGGPFNICQYAALLCMVAKLSSLEPGTFIHTIHDAHIYTDQLDGVREQLSRKFAASSLAAPKLTIHGEQQTIDDFELDDFELVNYNPLPRIKFPVAV